MATFIPVANTAEVKIKYTYGGSLIMNTLYFKQAAPWTQSQLQTLADSVNDHWASDVMIDLAAGLVMTEVEAISLESATAPGASHVETHSGSVNTGNLPANVCFAIKFVTALRGRSYRGRIYLPGISLSSELNPGFLTTAAADALREDVDGAIGQVMSDTGAQHCVVSRYSGVDVNHKPIPRVAGVATPVTAVVYTDAAFDSQRRRLPGRGQ